MEADKEGERREEVNSEVVQVEIEGQPPADLRHVERVFHSAPGRASNVKDAMNAKNVTNVKNVTLFTFSTLSLLLYLLLQLPQRGLFRRRLGLNVRQHDVEDGREREHDRHRHHHRLPNRQRWAL